jgi:hypothetical protein
VTALDDVLTLVLGEEGGVSDVHDGAALVALKAWGKL